MRAEKQLLLDEIQEKMEGANTFLLTRYERLDAKTTTDFRKSVRESGGDFEVVRKSVLKKACEAIGVTFDPELMEGHIALVLAYKDPVATIKAVFKTGKETNGAIKVMAGRFEGMMYSAADVEKISKLPDMDTMRAGFLGLLEAPMAQTLAVMDALLTSMPHLLANRIQQSS